MRNIRTPQGDLVQCPHFIGSLVVQSGLEHQDSDALSIVLGDLYQENSLRLETV